MVNAVKLVILIIATIIIIIINVFKYLMQKFQVKKKDTLICILSYTVSHFLMSLILRSRSFLISLLTTLCRYC